MLYILAALKCEASVLNGLPGKVIFTGVGLRANDIMESLDLKPEDMILNVGVCAGRNKGKGYLINKVTSMTTGKTYYPDILFETGIEEMPLMTSPGIVNEVDEGVLVDMEAAIISERVLKVIPPSHLTFYKAVSDSGTDFMTAAEVADMMRQHLPQIKKIARLMLANSCKPKSYEFLPESVAEELHLTQHMRNELDDIEHYLVVSGRHQEFLDLLEKYREEGRLPATDKKAGREVLNEIYSYLR